MTAIECVLMSHFALLRNVIVSLESPSFFFFFLFQLTMYKIMLSLQSLSAFCLNTDSFPSEADRTL